MSTGTNTKDIWLPLESNPDVINRYVSKLGVNSEWAYSDVWGLDDEILAFVPQPVLALLVLFPITDKYEAFRKEEQTQLTQSGQNISPNLYFCERNY